MATAYAGAIVPVFLSAAHTLNHYQGLRVNHLFFPLGNLLLQLELRHHPVIFSVKVFGGLIFIGASSNDGCSMFNLDEPSLGFDFGYKTPDITGGFNNRCVRMDMYQRVLINPAY